MGKMLSTERIAFIGQTSAQRAEKPMAKILCQVKTAENDKVAIQDWPTIASVNSGGRRYRAVLNAGEGELLELHLSADTAKALISEVSRKLAELPDGGGWGEQG